MARDALVRRGWLVSMLLSGCLAGSDGDNGFPGGGGSQGGVPDSAHCAPVFDWNPQAAQFEEDVLALTNQARARGHDCGSEGNFGPASSLSMDSRLRCAARLHSAYMARVGDDFSHDERETGSDSFERIEDAGYRFRAAAENLAVGQRTAAEVVNGWLESDGHCSNLMSPEFTQLGVGYAVGAYDSGSDGVVEAAYWTQTFGTPL